MSPERMRKYIAHFNEKRPCLILAYAQAAYELARFAEKEKIPVRPQRAVLTSAGTLYPFMREKDLPGFSVASLQFIRVPRGEHCRVRTSGP